MNKAILYNNIVIRRSVILVVISRIYTLDLEDHVFGEACVGYFQRYVHMAIEEHLLI